MKILVIGSGGREHCLSWKLSQNSEVDQVFCMPGNGGTDGLGTNVPAGSPQQCFEFARDRQIDLTVVGPEAPLADGLVDVFLAGNMAVIGPDRRAARLESSKIFAKQFMSRYRIPTAEYEIFDKSTHASSFLGTASRYPLVLKADGLAAGKGVAIVEDPEEARIILKEFMLERRLGAAGERLVIEEYLEGEEATVMLALDGKSYRILPSSQDHKRVGDGDIGPNTGGMGAYSPAPVLDDLVRNRLEKNIIGPLMEGMIQEELLYRGFLYLGLMIDEQKQPRILEFNVRLGDPETQVVLPRVENDWFELNLAMWEGRLTGTVLRESAEPVLGVVLASLGYPGHYDTGMVIEGLADFDNHPDDEALVFQAGTRREGERVVTAGGRVLNVCGRGTDFLEARDRAYQAISRLHFDTMFFRKDIGHRVLNSAQ